MTTESEKDNPIHMSLDGQVTITDTSIEINMLEPSGNPLSPRVEQSSDEVVAEIKNTHRFTVPKVSLYPPVKTYISHLNALDKNKRNSEIKTLMELLKTSGWIEFDSLEIVE